jgi:hypothetical protein
MKMYYKTRCIHIYVKKLPHYKGIVGSHMRWDGIYRVINIYQLWRNHAEETDPRNDRDSQTSKEEETEGKTYRFEFYVVGTLQ